MELHILSHNLHRSLYAFLVGRHHNDRVLLLDTYNFLLYVALVFDMLYLNIYPPGVDDKNTRNHWIY
jgi:multisubunit Na+/H+ antiporter MnhF subunit